ncbi:hypothetical protein R1sor_010713 [Riccia sorocarpa]|uniref:Uncharacterized protein n=1 Tax=Riccia sorocarpa TaxID=122646 RepID=A0ABD3I1K2_9MARC
MANQRDEHVKSLESIQKRGFKCFGSCLRKGFEKDGPKWPSPLKSHDYHILLHRLAVCPSDLLARSWDTRSSRCHLRLVGTDEMGLFQDDSNSGD